MFKKNNNKLTGFEKIKVALLFITKNILGHHLIHKHLVSKKEEREAKIMCHRVFYSKSYKTQEHSLI